MTQSGSGMLIVLEEREADSRDLPTSSSQRFVRSLRQQILIAEAAKSSSGWYGRWKANLADKNRAATLAIISILFILSLSFGLGSAFQIRQAEGAVHPISKLVSGLLAGSAPEGAQGSVAGEATSTPERAPASYGADFSWPDRFIRVDQQRETRSSKVLWPISTLISTVTLGAWLLPRSNRQLGFPK